MELNNINTKGDQVGASGPLVVSLFPLPHRSR